MSAKKEMPDCPRPTTPAGLAEKAYHVRDRFTGGDGPRIWAKGLTYDDGWKLKQKLAGERKSTTVRVERMDRYTAAVAAAGGRSPQQTLPMPPIGKAPAKQFSLEEANAAALAAAKASLTAPSEPAPELTEDKIREILGEDVGDEDVLDALIDQAEADAEGQADSDAPNV
jgi:hypothetical protein